MKVSVWLKRCLGIANWTAGYRVLFILYAVLMVYGIAHAVMVRKYVFDSGLNLNSNKIAMRDGESLVSKNVYYKDGKIIKRNGFGLYNSLTNSGTDTFKVHDYTLASPGVFGALNFVFGFNITLGPNFLGNYAEDWNGTSNFPTGGVDGTYPYILLIDDVDDSILNTTSDAFDVDCVNFVNQLFCTSSKIYNGVVYPYQNFKLDGRVESNKIIDMSTSTKGAYNADSTIGLSSTGGAVDGLAYEYWSKTGTATTEAGVIHSGLSLNLGEYFSTANPYRKSIAFYYGKPSTGTTNGTLRVYFSTAGLGTDYKRYDVATSADSGWKEILTGTTASATSGSTDTANITVIAFTLTVGSAANTYNTTQASTICLRPTFTSIGLPSVAVGSPASSIGAAGVLTGTYTHKITCARWDGSESNMGSGSTPLAATADRIDLTSIDVCNDGGADNFKSRKIYRNKNGGTVFYLVADLGNNVDTTYTDNTADSSLVTIGPVSGLTQNDNTTPH